MKHRRITPANRVIAAYRCTYVTHFLKVARDYDLPITKTDADSIRHTAQGCQAR